MIPKKSWIKQNCGAIPPLLQLILGGNCSLHLLLKETMEIRTVSCSELSFEYTGRAIGVSNQQLANLWSHNTHHHHERSSKSNSPENILSSKESTNQGGTSSSRLSTSKWIKGNLFDSYSVLLLTTEWSQCCSCEGLRNETTVILKITVPVLFVWMTYEWI
jgi:hypothetical protein